MNGELVDPEALDRDPFIQQVEADAKQIATMEAPDRYSIRLHPNEGGITGIWDAALDRFYEEGNQVLRFAEQDNAIEYLSNIQRIRGVEQTEPIFTTPTGVAYKIGDGVSSSEVDHKAVIITIEKVDEDDVWCTMPSEPEQGLESVNRNSFERYLDTGYFSVMDKEQPIKEVDTQREADEAFAGEHLIPRESTFEIDGRRFIVDSVNLDFGSVSLQDVTFQNATGFPIFRSESIEFMRRFVEISEAQRTAELPTEPKLESETVAFYSAEDTHLPYDVEIRTIKTPEPPTPKPELHNFRITDDHLGEGGAKAKFRMNMDAINLLKELEFDGRQATPEEQAVLAKYVGWGGLADAFDETKDNWKNEFAELYATLSPEEYAAARSSTLNAHYTSPTVIKAIYEAVGNMGFETGNILEPSMGVGNFFGCLPETMQNSKLYGVELDSITGRIAKQLYPKADITIAGFETTDRRDFYDLAIGNVPFGQYQVNDRAYNKLGFSIHDYFFAKALDQVRPGGVVAFVTSRYTMDKQSPEVRKYIAQRADLLGAIRLPNNAFKANAGTEVVSDIIFLQKRDRPIEIEPDWVQLGKNDDGFSINRYFIDNPEMVLGRQTSESTQYGKQDFTVEPYENLDLGVQLKYAIQNIKGSYIEAELPDLGDGEAIDTSIPADPNVKNYSYTVVDGEVYYRENSRMVKPELNATAIERVRGMVELRDCVQNLIGQQMDGYISDETIRQTQRELDTLYDNFTAKHGLINSRGNALAFADDSSYYLLCSLEVLDEDNNLKG